jgi:serine/threonine protein kinase
MYHRALEHEPGERPIFLDKACAGDEALRTEVESLLAHHQQAGSFIETPALKEAQALLRDQSQSMVGLQIGAYRVLSLLGRGGMGEVYLAEDSRLGRKVALKLLPSQFTQDQDRVLRFKREARAASALNHPNILTVYEISELDGHTFMVTEYVEGKTLRDHLARGRLKLKELLDLTIQVASALSAAHEAGIVHRDIKPENIMLRSDGYVKVLDFGLAKRTELPSVSANMQTRGKSALKTESGIVMGTAPYMSPEQVLGEKVDQRSDVFSLGVVTYEMATGTQPFQGNSSTAILDAILHKVPTSPRHFNPELPTELEQIITKALDKDRELRYQTVSDLRTDLKRLKRDTDSEQPATATASVPPVPSRRAGPHLGRLATVIAGVILATAILMYFLIVPLPPPKILRYIQLTNDGQQKLYGPIIPTILATDGSRLYFNRSLGGPSSLAQVSVTGGETAVVPTPFENLRVYDISPNHSELLVGSISGAEWPLWVLPVLGGSARRLGDVQALGGTWSPDRQKILYAAGRDLYLAKSDGTEPRKLVTAGGFPYHPRWSPDGTKLRFSIFNTETNLSSLWEVSADGNNLHSLLPGWNNPPAECCGNWTPDGKYFVFQSHREGMTNIWAIREKGGLFRKHSGEPVQLTGGAISAYAPVPSIDGKKLFVVGAQRRGELVRYDAKFGQFVPYLSGISAEHLSFSRDGQWVAYLAYPEANLWRSKVDGSRRLQLTFPPMQAILPHWSPDGKRIAFVGRTAGKPWKVYTVLAEGGNPQQLLPGEREEHDPDWSPNGDSLVFGRDPSTEAGRGFGPVAIHRLDLKTRKVSTLPDSEGLSAPVCSPDGRYVAAVGEGARKLLLFDFTTQEWVELAKSPMNYISWSRDGRYVYFDNPYVSDPAIFRVGINDRRVERVVSLKDFRRESGSWAGAWFGLTPDNSPLLLRSAGSQQIYALDWEAP